MKALRLVPLALVAPRSTNAITARTEQINLTSGNSSHRRRMRRRLTRLEANANSHRAESSLFFIQISGTESNPHEKQRSRCHQRHGIERRRWKIDNPVLVRLGGAPNITAISRSAESLGETLHSRRKFGIAHGKTVSASNHVWSQIC